MIAAARTVLTSAYAPAEFTELLGSAAEGRPVRFMMPIDVILVGPCRTAHKKPLHTDSLAHLFGEDYGWTTSPHAAYLRPFLEDQVRCTVLLISDCCGNYSPGFRTGVEKAFPSVTWIVPETRDYHAEPRPSDLLEDLVQARIVGFQK